MRKRLYLILLAVLASGLTAGAQRTAYKQPFLDARVTTEFTSVGGDISFGMYDRHFYWSAGLLMDNLMHPPKGAPEQSRIKGALTRLTPYGAFMYRLLRTNNRAVNLYGGGDVFIGIETFDLFHVVNNGETKTRFIYGGALRLEGEFFVSMRLAILVPVRFSVTGNTKAPRSVDNDKPNLINLTTGLGIRYNF